MTSGHIQHTMCWTPGQVSTQVKGNDLRGCQKSCRTATPIECVSLSAEFARKTSRDASDLFAAGVAPSREPGLFWRKNHTGSISRVPITGGLITVAITAFLLIGFSTSAYSQSVFPEVRVKVHPHIHVNNSDESEFTVTEQETINKSFPFPATGERRKLDIDNVWGSIRVTGGSSDQVQLVAQKTIRAESKDKLELAKKEVTLDIGQQGSTISFYVNGPFRCHCDDCSGHREREGYIVKYDFELQVPRDVDLTARTVNDGDVVVQNVAGQYSVHNVNGPVEMTDVAGSGDAKTVNGELKVLFRGNPQSNSSFASINGDVNLYFLPKLSADLRFKTFNGAVFSDFEMSSLPQRQPVEEHQNGKFIFRADRYAGGRIAGGGPEIKVETLNGDIHIRERHD